MAGQLAHAERRAMPYPAQAMFDMVADVERYPEFLPWCTGARVQRREGSVFWADLLVGYRMIREKFTSRVNLDPENLVITVDYVSGPLENLSNVWRFEPAETGCVIDFQVNFEFKSKLFGRLASLFFDEIVKRMVGAFVARADALYAGTSAEEGVPAGGRA